MALPATTFFEVETGGSDTLNGGCFDTASTGKPTDLVATSANTSSPVVTSASYNFVAGDVGNWLYVQAGTNWTPGWYKIVSVAVNAATLSAAIGAAFLFSGAACRAAGIPGVFPGGLTTGFLDIGAVQHACAAGGGLLTTPGLSGGIRG